MTLNGTMWAPVGPSPVAENTNADNGMVTAIAVNPSNPNITYIGTTAGGVWRSRDNGTNWTPLFDRQIAIGKIHHLVDSAATARGAGVTGTVPRRTGIRPSDGPRCGQTAPQRNRDACTTDDCGARAVADPSDAQLNSSRTTAKPTDEGAEFR
jgi:hypothetical protein